MGRSLQTESQKIEQLVYFKRVAKEFYGYYGFAFLSYQPFLIKMTCVNLRIILPHFQIRMSFFL
jgi:hypothetical protein